MELFKEFIVNNFLLLCISLVLISNCIMRFKQHPRISFYTILLLSNTLLIAFLVVLTSFFKLEKNIPAVTVTSMLGYVLRPLCIFFIIMMTGKMNPKHKLFPLLIAPLIANLIVYILMFIPGAKELVVYYVKGDDGGIVFQSGNTPLRYFSHIISGLYIIFLLYVSIYKISGKHILHGITLLSCAVFVVLAVIIETFFNSNNDIQILNNTIAVCTLIYYLYLYIERTQIDTLTGLFNRETYYHDKERMGNKITGVIHFDMNGLKYINDNFGHFEGDKALAKIADVISKCAKNNMYVYRLGGDEYIILCVNGTEQDIIEVAEKFHTDIRKTEYHCSYGYSYRGNRNISVEDLIKEAEKKMYQDKERFYENSPFARRLMEEKDQ